MVLGHGPQTGIFQMPPAAGRETFKNAARCRWRKKFELGLGTCGDQAGEGGVT